jgi:hypothetical protein
MNLFELLGIIFLIIIIVNLVIGVWAIKKAFFAKEDVEAYSRR